MGKWAVELLLFGWMGGVYILYIWLDDDHRWIAQHTHSLGHMAVGIPIGNNGVRSLDTNQIEIDLEGRETVQLRWNQ